MKVTKAVATIEPGTDDAESPNGTFHVVLSTPTKDRDGEEVKAEEWEQPLPDHITFDMDHGMSVASTVGSGTPTIESDGKLHVRGIYSSRPVAQEVRGLVNEGHIRTTSVAFLRKSHKDEKGVVGTKRELLNGAFVAIPANKEAVVLASKSATVELDDDEISPLRTKAGARHSTADLAHIQAIHDHAVALGADSASAAGKSLAIGAKAVAGSYEQRQRALSDALDAFYRNDGDGDDDRYAYAYPSATFDDRVIFHVSGSPDDNGDWQAAYTVNDDGTIALGTPERVQISEQVTPVTAGSTTSTEAGKSAAADDSAAEKAADSSAAADKSDSASIQVRAARIRALSALASLEGEN